MVDILALAVSHGLLALAVWRLLAREDLNDDAGDAPRRQQPRRPLPPRGKRRDA